MPIHIQAKPGQVAKTVLLPGNPQRAQLIAEQFLENPIRYSNYRLMCGYTGTYKGERISIQTTGMGAPSAAIIIEELISLGAENFIRIGTCGDLQGNLTLGQLIIPTAASALNGATKEIASFDGYAPVPNYKLMQELIEQAKATNIKFVAGPIGTMDLFYHPDKTINDKCRQMGLLALEMEASVTFALAARHGKKAATILTVSDNIPQGKRASSEVIKLGVNSMTQIALDTALAFL
jgi:purine-nucleoside phosphorylase